MHKCRHSFRNENMNMRYVHLIYIYISGVAMCQKVGRGGAHRVDRHVIFVPSVKNQYKRVVFGCMVI